MLTLNRNNLFGKSGKVSGKLYKVEWHLLFSQQDDVEEISISADLFFS